MPEQTKTSVKIALVTGGRCALISNSPRKFAPITPPTWTGSARFHCELMIQQLRNRFRYLPYTIGCRSAHLQKPLKQ
jgi:hypothetical protein